MLRSFLLMAVTLASFPLMAQTPKSSAIPRAADGHPDLQGLWTNATITPMERMGDKATVNDTEARAVEEGRRRSTEQ